MNYGYFTVDILRATFHFFLDGFCILIWREESFTPLGKINPDR